jgi:hypothetical protein
MNQASGFYLPGFEAEYQCAGEMGLLQPLENGKICVGIAFTIGAAHMLSLS